MANNYCIGASIFGPFNKKEREWFDKSVEWYEDPYAFLDDDEDIDPEDLDKRPQPIEGLHQFDDEVLWGEPGNDNIGFEYSWEKEGNKTFMWARSDESWEPSKLADLLEGFLVHFKRKDVWTFEWVFTCSKMRPGEFGGGAVCVSSEGCEWFGAGRMAEDAAAKVLAVRELRVQAEGLESSDFNDIVHDAASQSASNTNNEGLNAQLEFLYDLWDRETVKAAISEIRDAT